MPNGAVYTTVGDLAKFASFLMGNGPDDVLKITSLHHDLDQVIVPSNSRMTEGYGLGFMVRRRAEYVAFGHGGDLAGYEAAMYVDIGRYPGTCGLYKGGTLRRSEVLLAEGFD